MRLHIVTVGKPKLAYAQIAWDEYLNRLKHHHNLRVTHIADKNNTAKDILKAAGQAYKIALVIDAKQLTSVELAELLDARMQDSKEICFLVGGPEGLPHEVIEASGFHLSLSKLTLPHDLAMIVLLEALYRASTIAIGHPYHK